MNELQIFNSPEFGEVRVIEIDNEPWFVGKDVAEALGYTNPQKAIRDHVDERDKKMGERNVTPPIIDSLGREQYPIVINESALYALTFGSKLEKAKEFKHWVTSEILPSIRKHGAYATGKTLEKIINSPEFGIKLLQSLQEERRKKEEAERIIELQKPKVLFADAVATSQSSCLIGELAKIISQNLPKDKAIGQNKLFSFLREKGYLCKCKGERWNLPNQRYIEQGLFEIKKRTVQDPNGSIRTTSTTKVTGKGQQYFINLFLKEPA